MRTYSQLIQLPEYIDRFRYLSLSGRVGQDTFGTERFINQEFYRSRQWKQMRQYVIARDLGRDLASEGYEIHDSLIINVHHMNPMTPEDIVLGEEAILDPEFLITTNHKTHNAIHYGSEGLLPQPPLERSPGDHIVWGKRRRS